MKQVLEKIKFSPPLNFLFSLTPAFSSNFNYLEHFKGSITLIMRVLIIALSLVFLLPESSAEEPQKIKCYSTLERQRAEIGKAEKEVLAKQEAVKQLKEKLKETELKLRKDRKDYDAESSDRLIESRQKTADCVETLWQSIKGKRATLIELDKACKPSTKRVCTNQHLGKAVINEVCRDETVGGPDSAICRESKSKISKVEHEISQLEQKQSNCRSTHSQFQQKLREEDSKLDSNHKIALDRIKGERDKASEAWSNAQQKFEQQRQCLAELIKKPTKPMGDSAPGGPLEVFKFVAANGGGGLDKREMERRAGEYKKMLIRCEERSSSRKSLAADFPEFWDQDYRGCEHDDECMLAPTNCCTAANLRAGKETFLPNFKGYTAIRKRKTWVRSPTLDTFYEFYDQQGCRDRESSIGAKCKEGTNNKLKARCINLVCQADATHPPMPRRPLPANPSSLSGDTVSGMRGRLAGFSSALGRCESRSSSRKGLAADFPEFWNGESRICRAATDCTLVPTNCCASIGKALPGAKGKGYISVNRNSRRKGDDPSWRLLGTLADNKYKDFIHGSEFQQENFAEAAGEFQREQNCITRLGVMSEALPPIAAGDKTPWRRVGHWGSFAADAELKCSALYSGERYEAKCINSKCQVGGSVEQTSSSGGSGGQR